MDFFGIHYPSLGVPLGLAQFTQGVMYAALATFAVVLWHWRKRGGFVPLILLVPVSAQYVWFVWGSRWASFQEFVPFFHSLQYLLIAWSMQIREKADLKKIDPSVKYVWTESFRWGALNLLGGAALFYFIPTLLSKWTGISSNFTMGVFIVGVQIHHFFVDGVIWKLKHKSVVSPLMTNLGVFLSSKSSFINSPVRESERVS
jgi:hypothetical protein